MARETVAQFIEWLGEKPRTYGFDAILAYDQYKTNVLLIQEYIGRFTSEHYFDPVSFDAEFSSGTNWEYIYDYLLDAPRLSFETAEITKSEATLTMRIIGGTQLSVNKGVGEKVRWVSRVRLADALNGPLLRMSVDLLKSGGSVGDDGRVLLDISKGSRLFVTIGDSMEQDLIAGEKFQKKFDEWPEEEKVFELNTLPADPTNLLQPEKFTIRTHPAEGGDDRNSPSFGEGEVLLFIQMQGGAPDEDVAIPANNAGMHYLIPLGGGDDPLSATVLLGNHFMLKNIVATGFKRLTEQSIEVIPEGVEGQHIYKLTPRSGARAVSVGTLTGIPGIKNLTLPSKLTLPFQAGTGGKFFAEIVNKDILTLIWDGQHSNPVVVVTDDNQPVSKSVTMKWSWQQRFKFSTDPEGNLSLKLHGTDHFTTCKVSPDGLIGTPAEPHLGAIIERLESLLGEQLTESFRVFTGTVLEINTYRLHGLLFRTKNAVVPSEGYFTGDLALLGRIAPSMTNFVIDPIEPVVGPEGTVEFKIEPGAVGVEWTVMNLPDEDGDPGVIDRQTGAYQAPRDIDIPGYQKRVLVNARAANGNTSLALVSIVKRDIGIDPLVFVVTARSEGDEVKGHKMSAAALDGAPLAWSLASGSTAEIRDEHEPTPGLPNQKRFIPPLFQGNDETPVTIEEITVARVAGGPQQKAIAVVVHQASTYYIKPEISDDKRKVTVKLYYTDRSGNEQWVPTDQVEFTKLYGDGTFSTTGEYELPAVPDAKFAVLMAVRPDDEVWKYSFFIVPNPIVDVQSFTDATGS